MVNTIEFLESVVGAPNVIKDDQKLIWGKDYTKNFTPAPLAAVLPQSTEEVSRLLRFCNDHKINVVPSGGRTGLSAGAVAANQEIVISTARMKKIFKIDKTEKTIYCEAGVVTKELQNQATEAGLYFPVDFASSGSSQIGGNIATNAGGIKVIRYGLIRNWVAGIKAVLADGTILDMSNVCLKNNTGYDLKQIFIGSEGTLGIITEVIMRLTLPHGDLAVSLFALNTLEDVTKLFELAQRERLNLTAYEFFTEFALLRVQEHTPLKSPFAKIAPFYALVEIEKQSPEDEVRLESFVEKAFEQNLIQDGVMAQSSQQFQDFWGLRENISESITTLSVCHKNDISLPLAHITAFCTDIQRVIKENYPSFEVVMFGHIGDGNLHMNFIKPEKMAKDDFFKFAGEADKHMFDLVKKYGGSISAEHGVGLTKKPYLHYTRSLEEIAVMKGIKKVFDPNGIMNPGKIF